MANCGRRARHDPPRRCACAIASSAADWCDAPMSPSLCGRVVVLSGLLALVACLPACRSGRAAAGGAGGSGSGEASVKPGINAEYLKPDLNASNWVERFEREGREIFDQREAIVAAVGVRAGMTVADIGCGTGLFTPRLATATGPRGTVYAVDIVPEFLRLVARRASEAGQRNIHTVLCTERSVALPENSVDLAFLCDVYHHFEYPTASLDTLRRALRKGGEVVVIDFKRVPGVSSEWVMNHVRAGQEVVTAEFEAAGFRKVAEVGLLKDNYLVRFRKVGR